MADPRGFELLPGSSEGSDVRINYGATFPITDGRYLWRAWRGPRVIEGATYTRPDAEQLGRDALRELQADG